MALLADIPGFVDRADIRDDHPARGTATTHMWLNLTAVIFYVINAVIRYGALDQNTTPTLPLILSIVGVGILSFSGYLGGTMVYNDGIAVGRHRRHTDTPEETIRVLTGARDEFVSHLYLLSISWHIDANPASLYVKREERRLNFVGVPHERGAPR